MAKGNKIKIQKGSRVRDISEYAWNLTSNKDGWSVVGSTTPAQAPKPGPRTITKHSATKIQPTTSFIPAEIANTETAVDEKTATEKVVVENPNGDAPLGLTPAPAEPIENAVIKPTGSEKIDEAKPVAPTPAPVATGQVKKPEPPKKHTATKPITNVPNKEGKS